MSDTGTLVQAELVVGGMTCGSCAARIERRLNRLDGVALGACRSAFGARDHLPASDRRSALVTVIVTKTPRNEPDMVRRVETARRRRPRSEWA